MKKKKINYGIIGAGHIGKYHIQQIQNISDVNLLGIFDTSKKQCEKVARDLKTKSYDDINQLLKGCDAVSIATPARAHYETAKQALKSNCHLFIEKPLTTDLKEAENLITLSKQYKLLIQVGHIERFNPVIADFIKKQATCNPLFIETHRLSPFNIRGTDVDVVLDLMIHDIDLVLYLANASIKNIFASGVSVLSSSLDLVNARISFDSGCVANLTASRISDEPLRKLRLFEKNKYFSFDLQNYTYSEYVVQKRNKVLNNANHVFEVDNKIVTMENHIVKKENALYQELVSFINSIKNSQKVLVDAIEGKKAVEVALLIKQKIDEEK